jgi:serine protease inhibitor
MQKLIPLLIMICTAFVLANGSAPSPMQSLIDGNTVFVLDLYARLKSPSGNIFFSPYSISTCLAMVYAGARSDTERQIARTLHFGSEQIPSAMGEIQRGLNEAGKQDGIELSVANALWAQAGHAFLPAFLQIARNEYQANLNQADFKTGAAAAINEINRWVAKKTQEKIQDLLPPGSLTSWTKLVLANAIYFKGAWSKPFNKAETRFLPFHLSSTNQVQAPFMHHPDSVRYMENADFQAVELPYGQKQELSMTVLLPRQMDGCAQLENRLTPALLRDLAAHLQSQTVEIFLPRFKLESRFSLNDTLAEMGMPVVFTRAADFSGIDGTHLLYLSLVFHKAWCEVNEEGTEAAAATAGGIAIAMMRPLPPPPPVFRADHPFIFLIRDARSGIILFLGRLANPVL